MSLTGLRGLTARYWQKSRLVTEAAEAAHNYHWSEQ